jgi:hypothetical protein
VCLSYLGSEMNANQNSSISSMDASSAVVCTLTALRFSGSSRNCCGCGVVSMTVFASARMLSGRMSAKSCNKFISSAIFSHTESQEYGRANLTYTGLLLMISRSPLPVTSCKRATTCLRRSSGARMMAFIDSFVASSTC